MKSIYARLPVTGHYIQKRVALAGFARTLAGFAILLMVAAVVFFRLGSIVPEALIGLLLLSGGLGVLALLLALWGMGRAWFSGYAGGGLAAGAFAAAFLALFPFGLAAYLAAANPSTNAAVTQRLAPDEVAAVIDLAGQSGTQDRALPRPGGNEADRFLANEPSVVPGRRYRAEAPQVYRAVRTTLEDLGWTIRNVEAGEPMAEASGDSAALPGGDGASVGGAIPIPTSRATIEAIEAGDPDKVLESRTYRIGAVARDPLFALPSDVTIDIAQDGDEAFVDLKSRSQATAIDLGQNRRFIERFLGDLDGAMSGLETLDNGN